MIRVMLPVHLRTLARVSGEVQLEVGPPATLGSILDALEAQFPVLQGSVRDHVTLQRRPFVRFFACQQDISHEPADTKMPEPVEKGVEPLMIVGAMAGG